MVFNKTGKSFSFHYCFCHTDWEVIALYPAPKHAFDHNSVLDEEYYSVMFLCKKTMISTGLEKFFQNVNKQHQVKSFDNIHLL